jgi:hypothetical protein
VALGRQVLAEAALAQGELPAAERELSEALHAVHGYEVPPAEWRVCATAASRLEIPGWFGRPYLHPYSVIAL